MPRRCSKQECQAVDIAGLSPLSMDELRQLWARQFSSEPLPRISRELLVRAIAYGLQEERMGGLSSKEQRQLERLCVELERTGSVTLAASTCTRAGTRFVREWQGQVHEVIVLDQHFLWKGQRYRSLSEIARRITGSRWSGPRFFGLNGTGTGAATNSSESGHA